MARPAQMQKLAKEHSDIRELVDTLGIHRETLKRIEGSPRDAEGSRDAGSRVRGGEGALRRGGAPGRAAQAAAPAQGSQRRQEYLARDPRRHRRRGGGAVRVGSLSHVHALRRAPTLEGRGLVHVQRLGRRPERSRRRRRRQGRLRPAQVRIRRAPGAARAHHRGARAHPYLDGHGGHHARARGRGYQHRPQGSQDRGHAVWAVPAASRSTPPTRRCASTTFPPASTFTASRKRASTRTRPWP